MLTSDINPKSILTPEQMREKIDLLPRNTKFDRAGERAESFYVCSMIRKVSFRGGDFRRIEHYGVRESAYCFLNGHGERNIYDGSGLIIYFVHDSS